MTQSVSMDVSVMALFFPAGTLEWFDVVGGETADTGIRIVLENVEPPKLRLSYK